MAIDGRRIANYNGVTGADKSGGEQGMLRRDTSIEYNDCWSIIGRLVHLVRLHELRLVLAHDEITQRGGRGDDAVDVWHADRKFMQGTAGQGKQVDVAFGRPERAHAVRFDPMLLGQPHDLRPDSHADFIVLEASAARPQLDPIDLVASHVRLGERSFRQVGERRHPEALERSDEGFVARATAARALLGVSIVSDLSLERREVVTTEMDDRPVGRLGYDNRFNPLVAE
jgi:hypothetical protein